MASKCNYHHISYVYISKNLFIRFRFSPRSAPSLNHRPCIRIIFISRLWENIRQKTPPRFGGCRRWIADAKRWRADGRNEVRLGTLRVKCLNNVFVPHLTPLRHFHKFPEMRGFADEISRSDTFRMYLTRRPNTILRPKSTRVFHNRRRIKGKWKQRREGIGQEKANHNKKMITTEIQKKN